MSNLQARFAQLLGSIETKVEQIKQEEELIVIDEREENQEPEVNVTRGQGECEVDPTRLKSRQRQIDIGKNSSSYEKFISKYPRYCIEIDAPIYFILVICRRNLRPKKGPWTPVKYQKCSSRSWAGQMKKWRKLLHIHGEGEGDDDDYVIDMPTD